MSSSAITPEALSLLDAIARRGSFAGAADELGRAPSAITHAVRKLEDELDVLLFDRRAYRARLTAAGDELLREGRHLLASADDLHRRVQRIAKGWEQELRIALDTLLPFARLLPLLQSFCNEAPTQLRISHEVLGGTWDALLVGRADLALGATTVEGGSHPSAIGFRSLALGTVRFVFAVARTHPLAAADPPLSIAQMRAHRQIVVGDTSQRLAPRASGLLGAADVITVPTMEAKIAAQAAGLGVGFVPEHLIRDLTERGDLVVVPTQAMRSADDTVMLYAGWRADAAGRTINWWIERLSSPATTASLLS